MSEELNLNITELRRKRSQSDHGSSHENNGHNHEPRAQYRSGRTRTVITSPDGPSAGVHEPAPAPFDLLHLLESVMRRWKWVAVAAGSCAIFSFLVGVKITTYTAKVSLIRRENPNALTAGNGENMAPQAYISRELSPQTIFGMMRSPEVLHRTSLKAVPPVRPEQLAKAVGVIPERNPDFVSLTLAGKQPREVLAKWANYYADEVVKYMQEVQAGEAGEISEFLKMKIRLMNDQLDHVNRDMAQFSAENNTLDLDKEVDKETSEMVGVETKIEQARIDAEMDELRIKKYQLELSNQAPSSNSLQDAQAELERLRFRYTDLHPDVIRQKAIIAELQKQGTSGKASTNLMASALSGGSYANALRLEILGRQSEKEVHEKQLKQYQALEVKMRDHARGLSKKATDYAQLKTRLKGLEDLRVSLMSKQQEAQLLQENAMGYFKVFSYATPGDVSGRKRLMIIFMLSMVGTLLGLLGASGLVLIAEAVDRRVKTAGDLERATRLPILATLGDLRTLTPEEQINWAFRTLTLLQGKLNNSSDQTLVCGFISSQHREGRSTWIDLLVSAASQRGMRVLTVATRPTNAADEAADPAPRENLLLPSAPATTLTKNVLAFPAQVTEQFNDPQAQPIVHIPLPGWVWNLERRQQWRSALDSWEGIQNLVLLVELPPACQPESVLLAEHLPQVIWLANSGVPDIEETRAQLETLRHARCNLVGAVLNRAPSSKMKRRLVSWARRFSVLLLLASACSTQAAQSGVLPATQGHEPTTNSLALLGVSPNHRAPWQQRLTLGPGDAFDLAVFGHPEMTRTNLVIGPDGRVSFFQIQDFPAAGYTIDELRSKFETELSKYFVGGVRTILTPAVLTSKKYYVLGKVMAEGTFILDRPVTIIEAVARAKGLQTGAFGATSPELADFSRSFLARRGQRVPIDFERLFHEGDLTQNAALEPNDYLYFAAASPQEVYVLGEVLTPTRVPVAAHASVLLAISASGGFTPRAYRQRVLVIRGSLQKPEAYAVDTRAILAGRTPDFRLQPHDIIYVNARPWFKVEELLDIAAQGFIEAAVTTWTGENVPAVFTSPVLPQL
jgi:protein involved in polysaccharide export with SLBB domain/capsular polysaccharide biosynthesis protein